MKQNDLITGYQYGPTGRYIGSYNFEKNADREAVHMPPNTTLIAPPEAPAGKFAQWEAARERWTLVDVPPPPPPPPMPDPRAYELAAQAAAEKGEVFNGN